MALRHEPFEECRCCDRARDDIEVYKQAVLASDTIVKIGRSEIFVPSAVRAEIESLRAAARDALARLDKGAPGWGVAKDVLRAALQPSQ